MNKHLHILLLAAMASLQAQAQTLQPAPKLVVNITIDQLRTEYIEQFASLYTSDGFKKLLQQGRVYESASYPFAPVDLASSVASIATGSTPHYHKITAGSWIDRETLRPRNCIEGENKTESPTNLATSTISDELKVSSNGMAIVYSIADNREAAILAAGHAANGAFWKDSKTGKWATSSFYPSAAQRWITAYNTAGVSATGNDAIVTLANNCVDNHAMGRDDVTDYLSVMFSAQVDDIISNPHAAEEVYCKLDLSLAGLINGIEKGVGAENVLFVLTGTGYANEPATDYKRFNIPTGTFCINKTANLLNMYLGALYGVAQYVEACYRNEIYLDNKLIEQKQLSYNEVISRSKEFLMMNSGVLEAKASPYSTSVSGDLIVETTPGWELLNEETGERIVSRLSYIPFPIIFYGAAVEHATISTPVTIDHIAPTLAKCIHIRAPNACAVKPLF